jgi:hypothetical protein
MIDIFLTLPSTLCSMLKASDPISHSRKTRPLRNVTGVVRQNEIMRLTEEVITSSIRMILNSKPWP